MHEFYGEVAGVRIARKHIGWYIDEMPDGEQTRRDINRLDSAAAQYDTLTAYLETLSEKTDRWVCEYREGVGRFRRPFVFGKRISHRE